MPAALTKTLAAQGVTEPFPIQGATLPNSLAGRDVLGRGRTGSGKTLAFGLALLARTAAVAPNPGHRSPWSWCPRVSWPSRSTTR
ncbi:DEAD/DEAH box helicase [Streptomyces kaempferi]